jgi:hypothetical protein
MSEDMIDQTFQVSQPAKLNVNNIGGSVEIRAAEDGVINITAVKQPHTGDAKRTEIQLTQEADGTVKVATRFPDGSWSWMFGSHPCDVDYVIKAPHQCSVKVNGVSNTAHVEGFEGNFILNSVSGEVTLRDLTGAVRIHTVSGDADVERVAGPLEVDTVSGDVELKDSKLSSVKANTVSGKLRVHTALMDGPYKFDSVSGDVTMTLPADTHCTAELHSVSGDLASAFPVTGYSHHHGSQTVNVQGGGVKVNMNSVSGDLSLDTNGVLQPESVKKSVSTEERRAVLESVERGEMTVEEALGKLHE